MSIRMVKKRKSLRKTIVKDKKFLILMLEFPRENFNLYKELY